MKQKYQILLDVEIEILDSKEQISNEQANTIIKDMHVDGGTYIDIKKISWVEVNSPAVTFPNILNK